MVKPPTNSEMKAKTSERRVEEAECLADGAGRFVDDGLTGHHLHIAWDGRGDASLDLRLVRVRCRDDVDAVELADLA